MDAEETNEFFRKKAEGLSLALGENITVPHIFKSCEAVKFGHIVENLMVILTAHIKVEMKRK